MITTVGAYLHCLSFNTLLQQCVAGTADLGTTNPALLVLGPAMWTRMQNNLQAVVNAYLVLNPQSGTSSPMTTSISVGSI